MRAAVIINPASGRRRAGPGWRVDLAQRALRDCGVDGPVQVSQHPGHAHDLARIAVDAGASIVFAWGGDGTINEVGSALAFGPAALAIVPGGSGNGLARDLGIPFDPAAAIRTGLDGRERVIDAGELHGRLFFNVAGLGLDARVASRFAAGASSRRGLARYALLTAYELFAFAPEDCVVIADGAARRVRPLLVALANSRQYGNGALIAPPAQVDDGRLDLVVVEYRPPLQALRQVPQLFSGRIAEVPGVRLTSVADIEVSADRHLVCHVDGEPFVAGTLVRGRVRAGALRVRVPAAVRA